MKPCACSQCLNYINRYIHGIKVLLRGGFMRVCNYIKISRDDTRRAKVANGGGENKGVSAKHSGVMG